MESRAKAAMERHRAALLGLPNVVGVGIVADTSAGGQPTEGIQVYVRTKVPDDQLQPGGAIPRELDGVRVRVREIGELEVG